MSPSIEDRFWAKVEPNGVCWEWAASRKPNGYGQFGMPGRRSPQLAHRVAYELLVGPIPEGLCLDHLCRNRGCVNVDHLEPVTQGENTRRGFGGWRRSQNQRAQTHCKHGHEFAPENTRRDHDGHRECRACTSRRGRQHYRLQKGALA